jgi:hypothetical protein
MFPALRINANYLDPKSLLKVAVNGTWAGSYIEDNPTGYTSPQYLIHDEEVVEGIIPTNSSPG